MKKILLLLLPLLLAIYGNAQETIIQFKVDSKKELQKISHIVSIDDVRNGLITAYANVQELSEFAKLGYSYKVLPHPSEGKVINMATTIAQMADWDRYPTYDVYIDMMNQFETDYPNLCQVVSIGTSIEGREILAVKISDNVSSHESEPEFFYTGTMHGDETAGFVLLLRFADWLLSNYGSNTDATYIVDNFELYINPAANPDGTYNGGNNTVASATRYNANSTDINRDFPYPLESNAPYEPETQAMMDFAEAHHFVASANMHGGAEVFNYPWDCWDSSENPPVDQNWWEYVGTAYVATARINNSNYMTGVVSDGVTEGADWYYAFGSRQDYMNWFHACREVTLELSNTKLLSSDDLPTFWGYNHQSFIDYIIAAGKGFRGTVTNGNGDPLDAMIFISGFDEDNSQVYTDPLHGDYYRPIEPGTYDVTYSSEGYISQTIQITISDWESTVVQDVVLEPAQQLTVTGTVIDAETSLPLENAQVTILNSSYNPVYTNASGEYTISDVYEGNYDIQAYLAGYAANTQNVDISETNHVLDFSLAVSTAYSFEEGINPLFTFNGDADWYQTDTESYDGNYSARSGSITHDENTVMEIELNILSAGNISFYKMVSSESGYDYLKFYIDGNEMDEWSGDVSWSQESYSVSAGIHTFSWEYSKDGSMSSGSDCAWVDYIEFPEHQQPEFYNVTFFVDDGTNPLTGASVQFNGTNETTDSNGSAVFSNVPAGNALPYSISKTGFETETGTVNVVDGDITETVTLYPEVFSVTFTISNGANPIENAEVSLDGYGTEYTDADGHAVFSSVAYNPTPGYGYTINADGYYPAFGTIYVDADETLSIILEDTNSISNPDADDITIYPNPASGQFTIRYDQFAKLHSIEIFDLFGRKVYENELISPVTDIQNLPKGFYTIRLIGNEISVLKKLVIK